MILLFIVYSNAVDEEMVEIVKRNSDGYTKFFGIQGEGHGEPQLGTHIWPGKNNCIMAAIENKNEKSIVKETRDLKERFPGVGIHIMEVDLKKVV